MKNGEKDVTCKHSLERPFCNTFVDDKTKDKSKRVNSILVQNLQLDTKQNPLSTEDQLIAKFEHIIYFIAAQINKTAGCFRQ